MTDAHSRVSLQRCSAPFVFPLCLILMVAAMRDPSCAAGESASAEAPRPNILWLSCEDISPHLGCYHDEHAITPHLDAFAKQSIRYTRAFTTAGVCAPCRSGIITGLYQTSLGTHHMRCTAKLPDHIRAFPSRLRRAGYYCTNNSKQDYQFATPKDTWDESSRKAHWRNRKDKTQPFFAVFNFTGCHESGIANESKYRDVTSELTADQRQDPKQLTLPPYYPDTPVVREDWKRNYELITAMDQWVASRLGELEADGLAENTIVFYWSDHGVGLPRAKRWLYDSGTHIPLVVRIPEAHRTARDPQPGEAVDRLVSSIDFAPTVLSLTGEEIPQHMQGRAFLGPRAAAPRKYVYGARDRMDERYDIIRMVRDKRFKYIRNYEPLKTYYQYINTSEKGATMRELRRIRSAGKLSPAADAYFADRKPVEELYDCQVDPHELNNLATAPEHAARLTRFRAAHQRWVQDTKDVGLIPEPIIAAREAELGSAYAILRQPGGDALNEKLGAIAVAASSGVEAMGRLADALEHDDSAIRYWGATGLGNLGEAASQHRPALKKALADPSPTVRVAAARAICRSGEAGEALSVLSNVMLRGAQWERLQAAIVLDEMDEQARPVLKAMQQGLAYQEGFNAKGKYRVRVLNRALNELMGTDNSVP